MAYTAKGTTDAFTACEICGRSDLKKTVILATDCGQIIHAGVDCAARATGWTEKEVKAAAKTADKAAKEAAAWAAYQAAKAEDEAFLAWLGARANATVTSSNLHDAAKAAGFGTVFHARCDFDAARKGAA